MKRKWVVLLSILASGYFIVIILTVFHKLTSTNLIDTNLLPGSADHQFTRDSASQAKSTLSATEILAKDYNIEIRNINVFEKLNWTIKYNKNCNLQPTQPWAKSVFAKHSIRCGMEELTNMAFKIGSEGQRSDESYQALESKVLKLYTDLNRAYRRPTPQALKKALEHSNKTSPLTKSLMFIRAYKVASTHITSLLVTLAFAHNLVIDNPRGKLKSWTGKQASCKDISGLHYLKKELRVLPTLNSSRHPFCNDPLKFMFIRDPIERLWSGFNHYIVRAKRNDSLSDYLNSDHLSLTPPHTFLSSDVEKALRIAESVTFFDQQDLDVSLIMLAMKTGLSLCDIVYVNCDPIQIIGNISRCNYEKLNLEDDSIKILTEHAELTKEKHFYDTVIRKYNREYRSPKIAYKLKQYITMVDKALQVCMSQPSVWAWESIFSVDPRIVLTRKTGRSPTFTTFADQNLPIKPTWVCMQQYCRNIMGDQLW